METVMRHQGRVQEKILLRLFLLLLLTAVVTGCTSKNFAALLPGIEKRGHYIEGVPFFRQTESTCGPAALASVIAYWNHSANLEEITAKVYLRELGGTLPMDIEIYAREAGFNPQSSSGTLDSLKETIRKGVPIICLLDLGFGPYRRPHFVTVTGFDDQNRVLVIHDGVNPDQVMEYDVFDKRWKRAGRWMIVISPKAEENRHE